MTNENINKGSLKALIPFIVFIALYLGVGLSLTMSGEEMGFYAFKSPIAVIVGIISAFILTKGTINEKFDTLIKGCGDQNIIIMCIIYILAGAFSSVSSAMGGVESTVNLGLSIIPPSLITVGLFIIAAFISLATGSSVGTIVALGPIAVGFSEKTTISLALMLGALVGGSMFGDNLSVISDTTIAATRTQGVAMRDKFRNNILMAIPAVVVTIILLLIFGRPEVAPAKQVYEFDIVKVLPYLFVLIAALAGMNVFLVLLSGTIISGAVGLLYGSFGMLELTNIIYDGFNGMFEIFLLSLLTGGLAALVKRGGGIDWVLYKISNLIRGEKTAEIAIAAITILTNTAVANNTVAIIIDGPIVRNICKMFKVDPRRSASLLDSFAAITQGFIPYGAQILMATQFSNGSLTPFDVMPMLWYQFALGIFVILSIFIPYADGYIKKHPWDFDKWQLKKEVVLEENVAVNTNVLK